MSRATVLLVLAALSYGGCKAAISEQCIITDETATCDGEQFEFPLNLAENITQLYIHSTQVKTISKDNFAQYNDLEVIDLSNCGITDIDPDTFTALSTLNELNLAGNKELSGEIFISSQSLTKLNLSETGNRTIPENFFEELPNLEELDLSYTLLTETQISTLLKHTNLSTLIISKDYADELNNFCGETISRTIVFKTVDGDDETHDCSEIERNNSTPAQQDFTTVPNIIVNQSESDDNGTKAENTEVNQSEENDGVTTESNEDKGTTEIVEDNTADKNTATVKKEELETVNTSDAKPKDDEQEQSKNENDISTAAERHDNQTPPEVLDTNDNSKIAPALNNETAKTDEPETENVAPNTSELVTENVAQNTSEAVTENVAKKTDEPVTENVDDKTLSENGTEGTTTDMNNITDQATQVFSEIANSQKNNKTFSIGNPPEGAGDAENKTSEVTSSAAQSSGTNVVLGIILTVMVIGAVGFGYKYWKNRRGGYSNANTEETHEDGKELQTIVTHHTDPEQN